MATATPSALHADGAFDIRTVDEGRPHFVGEHCAVAGDLFHPQICYVDATTGALRFAGVAEAPVCSPPYGWSFELIDAAGGVDCSIVGPFYEKRVAYFSGGKLKVAQGAFSGWTIEVVDSTGCDGPGTSIARGGQDAQGHIRTHLSYGDGARGDLRYAVKSWQTWSIEIVDSVGKVGAGSSIAADAGGNPGISYLDETNGFLRFAFKSAGAWTLETVDGSGAVAGPTSLEFDGAGRPCIAYRHVQSGGDLRFARKVSGSWLIQTVDPSHEVGPYLSLSQGMIAYWNSAHGDLRLATQTGGWSIRNIDTTGSVGEFAFLARKDPYASTGLIAYLDRTHGRLKLARQEYGGGTNWNVETVDDGAVVGMFCDIAVDSAGRDRMVYYDATRGDLVYAEPTLGGWTVAVLDSIGDCGAHCRIALDRGGEPWIAYQDLGSAEFEIAWRQGGAWHEESVAACTGGSAVDIAIDALGNPHVVFCGTSGFTYARRDAEGWHLEPIGGGATYASLALSPAGTAQVAFSTGLQMKFAWRGAEAWSTEVIEEDPFGYADAIGRHPTLKIDADGFPHVGYDVWNCFALEFNVRYANRRGGSWSIENVGSEYEWCGHPSMDLLGRATPVIAYLDYGGALCQAYKGPGGWVGEVVGSAGGIPGTDARAGCALALDRAGRPRIAYYDFAGTCLMWAYGPRVSDAREPNLPGVGLARVWPSPMPLGTALNVSLALDADHAVRLDLVDVAGRRVATRILRGLHAGMNTVRWDTGVSLPGIYFLRCAVGPQVFEPRKLIVIR